MSGPVPASPDRMPLADRHGLARPQPAIGTPLPRRNPQAPLQPCRFPARDAWFSPVLTNICTDCAKYLSPFRSTTYSGIIHLEELALTSFVQR